LHKFISPTFTWARLINKTDDVQNAQSNVLTRFDQVSYMICRRIHEENKGRRKGVEGEGCVGGKCQQVCSPLYNLR